MRTVRIAGIITVLAIVGMIFFLQRRAPRKCVYEPGYGLDDAVVDSFIPESASTESSRVDALYFYLSGVTIFFTLLIAGVIIFFVFAIGAARLTKFRGPLPFACSGNPLVGLSFCNLDEFLCLGATLYFRQSRPPQNAIEVYVVGKQWMWKFQHSTGQREINELHVPVGQKSS